MKIHQRTGSIFWFIIGGYVAIYAYLLGLGRFRHPGPGFIFFSGRFASHNSECHRSCRNLYRKTKRQTKEEQLYLVRSPMAKSLISLGMFSSICLFFKYCRFLLSTFLLMVFLFKGVEPTKWWIAIVSSLITILISYWIFKVWLEVPVPYRIFGVLTFREKW